MSLEAALLHGFFPSQAVGIPKNVMLALTGVSVLEMLTFFFPFFFGMIPSEFSFNIMGKEI